MPTHFANPTQASTIRSDSQLDLFRKLAAAMMTDAANWQWIGPHLSQRMFGITKARAEQYVARFGGNARQMSEVL